MAEAPPNAADLVRQFVGLTAVSPQVAQVYLANSSWDLQSAITEYYNPPEEPEEPSFSPQPTTSAPSQAMPTSSNRPPAPTAPQQPKKKFATLGDLNKGNEGHDDDDDDEENDDEDPNLYTGGEKSGLAVENPNELKKKILERAKRNVQRPGGDDPRQPITRFTGTARTLGGDDTPSQIIPDPSASLPQRAEPVTRRLHFWADGFSVDDGPLYALEDPRNREILAHIKMGRAPVHILNVTPDQEVDVQLENHRENYVQPKKKWTPFGSGGQRLGSPTPGGDATSSPATAPAVSNTAMSKSTSATESTQTSVDINEAQPTISLQIRLGDGSRLVSRFNTTHTIGDVYKFVNASNPASQSRAWALMTTFPSKELQDKSQALGDMAEFKRGGVVVQKWQ
ncbi:MAG: hypothetical protein Q9163_001148 [Psora crenata]